MGRSCKCVILVNKYFYSQKCDRLAHKICHFKHLEGEKEQKEIDEFAERMLREECTEKEEYDVYKKYVTSIETKH